MSKRTIRLVTPFGTVLEICEEPPPSKPGTRRVIETTGVELAPHVKTPDVEPVRRVG